MIHIKFDPANLMGRHQKRWQRWQKRAERAIAENIQIWEEWQKYPKKRKNLTPTFNYKEGQRIWTRLKKLLLKHVFNNKCAYCEVSTVRFAGDAEHFRPKGAVTVEGERMKTFDENGREIEHPGYFWLAYHWKNLLPACEACNSGKGKRTQFPLTQKKRHILLVSLSQKEYDALADKPYPSTAWKGMYYLQPDELNKREEPNLLHPYVDNPSSHLGFKAGGIIYARSDKGRFSIKVYNLEDELLRGRRQKAQESALTVYDLSRSYFRNVKKMSDLQSAEQAWNDMTDYLNGKEEFSLAVVDFLGDESEKYGVTKRSGDKI